ncbi:hypothetical protein [Alcanivorax quisquiliarum]|uniref:Uncharacterized protein n=1 Tax=Alcanivorax quisquiliarum TaxID=2933565 RepID=A0ABT0E9V0_9GAMM|nr:hypothetical protein [Alcanivorax quisquiliarum]MCK0538596.1 hypothetical protein [Alcanivorax quisquiliarum]
MRVVIVLMILAIAALLLTQPFNQPPASPPGAVPASDSGRSESGVGDGDRNARSNSPQDARQPPDDSQP